VGAGWIAASAADDAAVVIGNLLAGLEREGCTGSGPGKRAPQHVRPSRKCSRRRMAARSHPSWLSLRRIPIILAIPSKRGHLRLVDSCNFPLFVTIERQFTSFSGVRWCPGPGGHRTRRAPGRGRLRLPAFAALRGRRRLSAQGRASRVHVPGSLTVRGCPAVTAGLDAEGRPRTLSRRVPRPGRGSPFPEASGGEAASFWFWAAQRPARPHAASLLASDRS
jgi:hypothetical protein